MISVILPTYERADAVRCCIAALQEQTLEPDRWELIIVDDSESANIDRALTEVDLDMLRAWYIRSSPPRVGSFTAGRARNIGAANASGDLLVFVDQDVMLAPDALEHYETAYRECGDNVVILGLYHWMRRVDFDPTYVRTAFNYIVDVGLGNDNSNTRFKSLPMDVPGLLGTDQRQPNFSPDVGATVEDASLGCWSGNIGYPRKLFMELGGFDENIRGHGGEDADLGLTAKEHGARFLQYSPIWGVHRWHGRDQEKNALEVQENIAYIDRKHGIGAYANADKVVDSRDWKSYEHYHKDVGATLIQVGYTVYACRDGHALGLPTPDWLGRLGFDRAGLQSPPSGLDNYTIEGVASD